ncbi:MAG: polysulfide reductase NrfD [Candidatus Eremiobacteraeota bacterium]|nr:polysulfide reductase NrfD [Candidatus Eremiobacteraeota bacterium]
MAVCGEGGRYGGGGHVRCGDGRGAALNAEVAGGEQDLQSYYGRPIIKAPVWTDEIGWYLWVGGLAGASSVLAAFARARGETVLARRALLAAAAGAVVSPALLIADLGRPERFLNMLRVIKPTSPMNMGSWILTSFGACAGAAAASDLLDKYHTFGRCAEWSAALCGLALCTYTGVLLADTAVPVWHEARTSLPLVFGASAAASAGAWGMLVTPLRSAGAARYAMLAGCLSSALATRRMKRELGYFLAEPCRIGSPAKLGRLATGLMLAGSVVGGALGAKHRAAAAVAGACVLAGTLFERFSIFRAGTLSALDPKYTVGPQAAAGGREAPV